MVLRGSACGVELLSVRLKPPETHQSNQDHLGGARVSALFCHPLRSGGGPRGRAFIHCSASQVRLGSITPAT